MKIHSYNWTGRKPKNIEHNGKYWTFCSSGASPLYLENVVRALALPSGETLQFRYEHKIMSREFSKLFKDNAIDDWKSEAVGSLVYLSYLDNRDTSKPPEIYPVREAMIMATTKLGTSYIITLQLRRFINWSVKNPDQKHIDLRQLIKEKSHTQLPDWKPESQLDENGNYIGYWTAETEPLPEENLEDFSPETSKHVLAFESCVNAVSNGTDFKNGGYIFCNVLGIEDITTGNRLKGDVLIAGRSYQISVYHYLGNDSTHNPIDKFYLELDSENEDLYFVSSNKILIEARYDIVNIIFRIKEDAKDAQMGLNFRIKKKDGVDDAYIVRGRLHHKIRSNYFRRLVFSFIIGGGLFGTQIVTLIATNKYSFWIFLISGLLSWIAGLGAAFQFRTKM